MSILKPDATLSHYKIKQLIGRGGMGEVYKAVDLQLGRVVALKTLSRSLASDQNAHQRFLREARAASALSHPCICTVFEVGRQDDLAFIAMQYVEGKTIQQMLAQGPLPVEACLAYALDIADALDEAHRRGVIHRDIKPSNVIVNERGSAVVLDFGLAKQLTVVESASEEAPTQLQLTSAMTVVGTPAYMSPEQVRREALDRRSDIFSFGTLLYEMFTGVSPFHRGHAVDTLHAILHEEPKPVSKARPQVSHNVDKIIEKALAKDRSERYQSLAELKSDLIKLIEKRPYSVGGFSTGGSAAKKTGSGPLIKTASVAAAATRMITTTIKHFLSSLTWRSAAIAMMGVVLVVAVLWFFIGPRGESDAGIIASLKYVQLINWRDQGGVLQDSHGVMSRDGKMIAYRSRAGGKGSIWIKQTTGGDPIQVVKDDWNNWSPIFSPDGQEIAFLSTRGNRLGVWRIPTFGGTPTSITSLETPEDRSAQLIYWSTDDESVYFRTDSDLFSLNTVTKTTTQVTRFDQSDLIPIRYFSISPGEDQIAYVDVREGQTDLWVMPMAGGNPAPITNDAEEDLLPVWHPDGKRIIYSSKRDGVFQVCVAYLDGRAPLQITFGDGDSFVSDVSADGRKILYSGSREESDIWSVVVGAGEESQTTFDVGAELWPDVSPDGKALAFQSVSQLSQATNITTSLILIRTLDAEGRQTRLATGGMAPEWSPDGQKIAFFRTSGSITDLWTVSVFGGDEKKLTDRGVSGFAYSTLPYNRFNTFEFSWSHDGSRISYCSENPESSIWTISLDGQKDNRIGSSAGALLACPIWSPDGERIAYLVIIQGEQTSWSIWVTEIKTGESKNIYRSGSVLRLLGWSPHGDAMLVATVENKPGVSPTVAEVSIFRLSIAGGQKRPIAALGSTYLYNTRLAPDGQTIGFVSRGDGRDNIWVIPAAGGQARMITMNIDPRLYFSAITWSPDSKKIYFAKQSRNSLIYMISNFE